MITNKTNIDKIVKAIELVCPILKEKLITEAYIVGSVAKGTAKETSDIDIYLINPDFKKQKDTHDIQLVPELLLENEEEKNIYTNKIIDYLKSLGVEFKYLETKYKDFVWYQFYKDEQFHLMYDYESDTIKHTIINFIHEHIEITEELCNQINELE